MIGISFHNLTGTPPGSLVVGVGGGVPVRVTEVDERVLVCVAENEDFVPRSTRVFVEMDFVAKLVDSFPVRVLVGETVLTTVNLLVPKTMVGGAEISSVMLDRVHPTNSSEAMVRKKISFFIDR